MRRHSHFITGCGDRYGRIILPFGVQSFKFEIDLLHGLRTATLVGMVLQCQYAVTFLQFRKAVYILKVSHNVDF